MIFISHFIPMNWDVWNLTLASLPYHRCGPTVQNCFYWLICQSDDLFLDMTSMPFQKWVIAPFPYCPYLRHQWSECPQVRWNYHDKICWTTNHSHCTLYNAHFTPYTSYHTLHITNITPHASNRILHTAQFTPHTLHCKLHTAHFTAHTEHMTLQPNTSHYTFHRLQTVWIKV